MRKRDIFHGIIGLYYCVLRVKSKNYKTGGKCVLNNNKYEQISNIALKIIKNLLIQVLK